MKAKKTCALALLTLRLSGAAAARRISTPGGRMHGPAADNSSKRFMRNEKFLAALKEINR